jgi:hypothetical protein
VKKENFPQGSEEPLIILRYFGLWLGIRVFGMLLFTFFFGMAAFYLHYGQSDFKLIALRIAFFVSLFLFGFISFDLLLTDNVRLYQDRAVKTFRSIFSDVVCILENSNVTYVSYIYGKRLWIAPRDLPRFFNPIKIFSNRITFDCGLAKRKDIKALETVLQSLGIRAKGTFD